METVELTAPFHFEGSTGEAVVLIHGFTGHPGHWRPLSDVLVEAGYTVVAPRLAGHGSTPEELAATPWRDWAASAQEAAASVAEHRLVHLVGLSMGGLLAILLAGRVAAASITAINSPVLIRDPKAYLAPIARHLVASVPAEQDPVPDPDLAHLWTPHQVHSTAAIDGLIRLTWRAWKAAGRLRRPALVIQSRHDEVVRPVSGRLLAHRLKADLVVIDSSHNALLDRGRATIHRAIVDHLAAVGRWAGGSGLGH